MMTTESLVRPRYGPTTEPPAAVADLDSPVFADPSGRRAALMRRAAQLLGALVLLWLAAVAAGLAGLGTLPGVPLVGGSDQQRSAQRGHDVRPAPASPRRQRSSEEIRAQPQGRAHLGAHDERGQAARRPSGGSPLARARTPHRTLRPGGGAPVRARGGAPTGARPRGAPPSRPAQPAKQPPIPPGQSHAPAPRQRNTTAPGATAPGRINSRNPND